MFSSVAQALLHLCLLYLDQDKEVGAFFGDLISECKGFSRFGKVLNDKLIVLASKIRRAKMGCKSLPASFNFLSSETLSM